MLRDINVYLRKSDKTYWTSCECWGYAGCRRSWENWKGCKIICEVQTAGAAGRSGRCRGSCPGRRGAPGPAGGGTGVSHREPPAETPRCPGRPGCQPPSAIPGFRPSQPSSRNNWQRYGGRQPDCPRVSRLPPHSIISQHGARSQIRNGFWAVQATRGILLRDGARSSCCPARGVCCA